MLCSLFLKGTLVRSATQGKADLFTHSLLYLCCVIIEKPSSYIIFNKSYGFIFLIQTFHNYKCLKLSSATLQMIAQCLDDEQCILNILFKSVVYHRNIGKKYESGESRHHTFTHTHTHPKNTDKSTYKLHRQYGKN